MTERSLTTEVLVLNAGGCRGIGTATLDLRGDALVFHYARRNRLVTQCLSMTGATRELRPFYPFHLFWYGIIAAAFTLVTFGPVSARFGLDIGSPTLLFLLELTAVALGLWWLVHRHATPAIYLRFNVKDCVYNLVVKDDRTENPELAGLAELFRPFELHYHRYKFNTSAFFFSERGFSVPFVRQLNQALGYVMLVLSPLVAVLQGLSIQHLSPKLAIICYCLAPVMAIGAFRILQMPPNGSRPQPCPNELRTNRKALRLVAHGDSTTAINVLVAFLQEFPDATHARRLLAQVYIFLARYDDALDLFQPLPEADPDAMRAIVEDIQCCKSMATTGNPASN